MFRFVRSCIVCLLCCVVCWLSCVDCCLLCVVGGVKGVLLVVCWFVVCVVHRLWLVFLARRMLGFVCRSLFEVCLLLFVAGCVLWLFVAC